MHLVPLWQSPTCSDVGNLVAIGGDLSASSSVRHREGRVLQFLQRSRSPLPPVSLAPSAARAGLSGELPKHRNKIKCRCIRYTISHDKKANPMME